VPEVENGNLLCQMHVHLSSESVRVVVWRRRGTSCRCISQRNPAIVPSS
jgi:hypothetical protein